MKRYQAILFDLDGTLLPMDYDKFLKGYLHLLATHVAPLGYEEGALVKAMWKGVAAMTVNDGSRTNGEAFWSTFAAIFGEECRTHIPHFDEFYRSDFQKAKTFTEPTALAAEAVALAQEKSACVVLATNPYFPRVATEARAAWAGLSYDDFSYVTTYENSGTCKPNPAYYLEICEKLSLDPAKCLMIGNNAEEDIRASRAAGMDTFLLTDCLIAEGEIPDGPQGSFADLISFLKEL